MVCIQVHIEGFACVCALAVYILVLLKRLRFCYTLTLLNEASISYHETLAHQITNKTRSRYIRLIAEVRGRV